MRLINCETFEIEEFFGSNVPRYAILSHTWGSDEVTYSNLPLHQATTTARKAFRKIQYTCAQALKDELGYAWVDTCCIDKSSSAELSEAINSMFAWYRDSARCYVYLEDVEKESFQEQFPKSRWFTRGWTLQELIAPYALRFYDKCWNRLGNRVELAEAVSEITAIDSVLLSEGPHPGPSAYSLLLDAFCVAKRMSWASRRTTTRDEDMAYCLLGIFDIHMPLLYGEGKRAFRRLQEEIMKTVADDSILAWGLNADVSLALGPGCLSVAEAAPSRSTTGILAKSPLDFEKCKSLGYGARLLLPFAINNIGLQMRLPIVPVARGLDCTNLYVGLLSSSSGTSTQMLGILLSKAGDGIYNREDRGELRRPWQPATRSWLSMPSTLPVSICTVFVDPRIVACSAVQDITIVQSSGSNDRIIPRETSSTQFILNPPGRFCGETYVLVEVNQWRVDDKTIFQQVENISWDPERKVHHVAEDKSSEHLLCFTFSSQPDRRSTSATILPSFRVFIQSTSLRAIAQETEDFSDLASVWSELEALDPNQNDKVVHGKHQGITIASTLSVWVKQTNVVYNLRICEVYIRLDDSVKWSSLPKEAG